MAVSRKVKESPLYQGADEQIIYTLTTTPWGSTPTSQTMVVKDVSADLADVTATVTTGSMSVSGDVITLSTIKSLTAGSKYRVEVKFTAGGSIWEPYFIIEAEL